MDRESLDRSAIQQRSGCQGLIAVKLLNKHSQLWNDRPRFTLLRISEVLQKVSASTL